MQAVASRQVVLLLGAAGPETGSRNKGRLREHQLACALVNGLEVQGWDGQSVPKTGGCDGSCTVARSGGYSGSGGILDDDTLAGSELTTESRVGVVSPGCLEVGVRARAVSISPPWGSCETMGAHLPSEVYLGQDTRRPGPERSIETVAVVWRRSAGGPRLNFSHPSLHVALSQHMCTQFVQSTVRSNIGSRSRDELR